MMFPNRTRREPFYTLLHSLERLTRTDLRYLASGGFWLTLDQVMGALIAFLLIIGFGHFVAPEVFGTYRYLLATFWTLAAFTLTGLPTALSQAIARGYEGTFRKSFSLSLIGGIPLALIALGMSAYYFNAGNGVLGFGLLAIAILGPFMQPAHLFGSYLAGKKEFRVMALLGIVFALVPALGLGVAMVFTQNPLVFTIIYLTGNIVTGLALSFFTLRRYLPSKETTNNLRRLSWHFSLMNLFTTIAAQVDKIIVFHYLGAIQLAIYTFAVTMPEQIKGLFGSVSVLAFPKFATRSIADIRANFWNRLWAFTGLLALASLLYIGIAPYVFDIFFPKYTEAVWYSQIYALSLVLTSVAVPTTLLQARAAKKELYILNTLSPIFQIGALIFLTASYGLVGTIIARIISRFFTLLVSSVLAYSYISEKAPAN